MDERLTEAGRLVAEALTEACESDNPYALAKLTEDLASVGLMRLETAREASQPRWFVGPFVDEAESSPVTPNSPFGI